MHDEPFDLWATCTLYCVTTEVSHSISLILDHCVAQSRCIQTESRISTDRHNRSLPYYMLNRSPLRTWRHGCYFPSWT